MEEGEKRRCGDMVVSGVLRGVGGGHGRERKGGEEAVETRERSRVRKMTGTRVNGYTCMGSEQFSRWVPAIIGWVTGIW